MGGEPVLFTYNEETPPGSGAEVPSRATKQARQSRSRSRARPSTRPRERADALKMGRSPCTAGGDAPLATIEARRARHQADSATSKRGSRSGRGQGLLGSVIPSSSDGLPRPTTVKRDGICAPWRRWIGVAGATQGSVLRVSHMELTDHVPPGVVGRARSTRSGAMFFCACFPSVKRSMTSSRCPRSAHAHALHQGGGVSRTSPRGSRAAAQGPGGDAEGADQYATVGEKPERPRSARGTCTSTETLLRSG